MRNFQGLPLDGAHSASFRRGSQPELACTIDASSPRPLWLRAVAPAITLVSLLFVLGTTLGTTPANAITQSGDLLTDSGFNTGSQALLSFTNTNNDRWLIENGALIVGSENGVSPIEGDGMLRMAEAGGSASQVRQVVDVSDFAVDIDAGNVFATARADYNAPIAGAGAIAIVIAYGAGTVGIDAPQLGLLSTGSVALDALAGTWETRGLAGFALPALTRQVSMQAAYSSGTIASNGYVDAAYLELTIGVNPDGCVSTSSCTFGEESFAALGDATLAYDPLIQALIINNIQSSGEDGVSISLASSQATGIEWDWASATPLVSGAELTTTATGTINGSSGQLIGTSTVVGIGSGMTEVEATFSGSSTYSVFGWDGNVLVGSDPGHDPNTDPPTAINGAGNNIRDGHWGILYACCPTGGSCTGDAPRCGIGFGLCPGTLVCEGFVNYFHTLADGTHFTGLAFGTVSGNALEFRSDTAIATGLLNDIQSVTYQLRNTGSMTLTSFDGEAPAVISLPSAVPALAPVAALMLATLVGGLGWRKMRR